MEAWAKSGEFDVNFICICVNCDWTSLPTAKNFATKYKSTEVINGYVLNEANRPKFGQLGCQGLIVVNAAGKFVTKRSAAFLQDGERAFKKVEKMLFQLGSYRGDRVEADFEEPPLRLAVNSRVECMCGRNVWLPGTVVAHRVQARGREMPYQIRLDDGRFVFAPYDTEYVIRALVSDDIPEIPSVGVDAMDHEHEECMEALVRLRGQRSEENLQRVFAVLRDHFEHEERLFAESGFGNHGQAHSGTKSHCDDHARILSSIEAQFGRAISEGFVRGLIDHLASHTQEYDTKYAGKLGPAH